MQPGKIFERKALGKRRHNSRALCRAFPDALQPKRWLGCAADNFGFRVKGRLQVFAAAAVLLLSLQKGLAIQAHLLDTAGLGDVGELYLVGTLQGIVNRDAPRLFLIKGMADTVYADYLEREKGFTFTRLTSLPDAITTFTAMKRADGVTPLIKGLVNYPATYWDTPSRQMVNRYYNYWIAANFAAQEDLLPVHAEMLGGKTPMLSGSEFWHTDTSLRGWSAMFVSTQHSSSNGLRVTSGRAGAYASRVVHLDLEVTPKVEVVVSDLTPGGAWSLIVAMGSTVKSFEHREGASVPGLTHVGQTGTFVADLSKTKFFQPRAGRAELRITPAATGVTVTVKSIRFLDASGQEPSAAPYAPRKDAFAGLPIARDLAAAPPYEQNEDSACAWSLANQRSNCASDAFASYAGGAWILMGLDYTVANRIYHFYQDKTPFAKEGYPNLDKLLADLKAPGLVFGWLGNEDYACMKMGQYGARYAGGLPQNFSFWQWVPLEKPGKPVPLPQRRDVTRLENKVYVNFSWASADYIQISYNLMDGLWPDPNRGQVPVTWGFNPLLARYAPAFVEFYAHSATRKDSFWGFTAGYTHLSGFPPEPLQQYAEETRRGLHTLGLSPAVDVWDSFSSCTESHEALGLDTSADEGIKLLSVLPNASNAAETHWLDNGCPVVRLDRSLYSVWQRDGKSTPESIVATIKAAAAKQPAKGPQFLTCNSRFSPTFLKEVKELLPENIVMVGMPDFIALAQEAGAVTALPFSDAVGSGDSLHVSFELHNAAGTTGGKGKVSWMLPPAWTSSPESWVHEAVPKGGNLKQLVTFTPPAGMSSGTVAIAYKDSRFGWGKEMLLTTYPQGTNISDCATTEGWTATNGAAVCVDRGMLKITPKTVLGRHDHASGTRVENNGRVCFALKQVDLDRRPVLKIQIPDQNSQGTRIGVTDATGQYKQLATTSGTGTCSIDLSAVTKWTGTKDLTLNIDPATGHGSYVRIRSIKVCYP